MKIALILCLWLSRLFIAGSLLLFLLAVANSKKAASEYNNRLSASSGPIPTMKRAFRLQRAVSKYSKAAWVAAIISYALMANS